MGNLSSRPRKSIRFWEIDFTRGIAVVMMVIYHVYFDISHFGSYSGFDLCWLGRITGILFISLVGLCLTLSYSRAEKKGEANFLKYAKRGVKIFSIGLLISLATWVLFPKRFIVFGILHFIGVAVILGYFFVKRSTLTLPLGIVTIFLGWCLSGFGSEWGWGGARFDFPWLLWLGAVPRGFRTFDYYPLLPYFGFVLIGIYLGNLLYPGCKRRFALPEISNRFVAAVCWLGRNSLKIYLTHQPLIVSILMLLGLIDARALGSLRFLLD